MKFKYYKVLTMLIVVWSLMSVKAQDIDEMLEEATGSETEYVSATFKSTRIVTGHSVEKMPAKQLDFRISHRFGEINSGIYEYFGLDQANIHFGLEYGITNWLMAGIGRGTYEKTYDGFLKFTLLRQSKGKRTMPVSLSYLATTAVNTLRWDGPGDLNFWDRESYAHPLPSARKFN